MTSLLDSFLDAELQLPPPLVSSLPRREIWICVRVDGPSDGQTPNPTIIGSGTKTDPYDGSTFQRLDKILGNKFGGSYVIDHCTVRFGPGTFQTQGGAGNQHGTALGWVPLPGQKLIGSGMFVTTLQLVIDSSNSSTSGGIPIIGGAVTDDLEVADMTLDCNLHRLPNKTVPQAILIPAFTPRE